MFYGYRCYNKNGETLGWLYTYNNDTELVWTIKDLNWCKRWKTEKGAKNNFDRYNNRWQFKSNGGYLKIEIMPDIAKAESAESRRQKLLEEWGENVLPSNDLKMNMIFKSQKHMTQEQQTIAEDFVRMIESEFALCAKEIKRVKNAIIDTTEIIGDEDIEQIELANREVDAINNYWQNRLVQLIKFIQTKDYNFSQELVQKYLSGK